LDDDGAVHLSGTDGSLEDAATDGDIRGEGTLLVNVAALNRLLGGAVTKTNALVVANDTTALLAGELRTAQTGTVPESNKYNAMQFNETMRLRADGGWMRSTVMRCEHPTDAAHTHAVTFHHQPNCLPVRQMILLPMVEQICPLGLHSSAMGGGRWQQPDDGGWRMTETNCQLPEDEDGRKVRLQTASMLIIRSFAASSSSLYHPHPFHSNPIANRLICLLDRACWELQSHPPPS